MSKDINVVDIVIYVHPLINPFDTLTSLFLYSIKEVN